MNVVCVKKCLYKFVYATIIIINNNSVTTTHSCCQLRQHGAVDRKSAVDRRKRGSAVVRALSIDGSSAVLSILSRNRDTRWSKILVAGCPSSHQPNRIMERDAGIWKHLQQ